MNFMQVDHSTTRETRQGRQLPACLTSRSESVDKMEDPLTMVACIIFVSKPTSEVLLDSIQSVERTLQAALV